MMTDEPLIPTSPAEADYEARLAQAQPILRARTMPLFAAPSVGGESEAEGAYQEPPIPLAVTGP